MRDEISFAEPAEPRIDFGHVAAILLRKLPRIAIVTLVLCGVTYAVLLFMPRLYESSANLLVEPRASVYTSAAIEQGNVQYIVDDAQIASQIELIRSRSALLTVIDELALRDVPEFASRRGNGPEGDEEVLRKLRERIVVARERDSRLVTIAVRSEDPELAAEIANAIARNHVEARTRQLLTDTATATGWLQDEIDRLRVSVSEAEARVAEFRVANDLYVGANNTTIPDQQLSTWSGQIAAAAERRSAAQSRADAINALLANGDSVTGLPEVQASPIVQALSQELARLQGTRAERSATLLPNHPEMRALSQQIGELNAQIAAEARQVAASFETQARIEADLERSLREEYVRATGVAGTATRQGVTLAELEREAAAERELLNSYLLRYADAASRTEAGSAFPDVRLVSEAAPSSNPASPQTMLILVAVALVALVFQIVVVIFSELLSGRAVVVDAMRGREADEIAPEPIEEDDRMPVAPLVADVPEEIEDAAFPPDAEPEAEMPQPEIVAEADQTLGTALSRAIAEADAVIAAMPPGYGVFSPEYLGHGYPVPRNGEAEAAPVYEPEPVFGSEADTERAEFTPESEPLVAEEEPNERPVDEPVPASPEDAEASNDQIQEINEPVTPLRSALAGEQAQDMPSHFDIEIDALAEIMLSGRRVMVIAATGGWEDSCLVAERLGERLVATGLSVIEIDAASGTPGAEPGLSDLSTGEADFGDVVHRGEPDGFAYVPWGQSAMIERRSRRVATLVEAIADVYETVIIVTGRLGHASMIGLFTGLDAACTLVADSEDGNAGALEELTQLGFHDPHLVTFAAPRSEVA